MDKQRLQYWSGNRCVGTVIADPSETMTASIVKGSARAHIARWDECYDLQTGQVWHNDNPDTLPIEEV